LGINTGGVTSTMILDGTIAAADLATGAVTTTQILDGTIAAGDLGADAVTTVKITNANVTFAKLAANAVDSTKIVDKGVGYGDLTVKGALVGQVLMFNGASWVPAWVELTPPTGSTTEWLERLYVPAGSPTATASVTYPQGCSYGNSSVVDWDTTANQGETFVQLTSTGLLAGKSEAYLGIGVDFYVNMKCIQ
jgi:hypothetical protein